MSNSRNRSLRHTLIPPDISTDPTSPQHQHHNRSSLAIEQSRCAESPMKDHANNGDSSDESWYICPYGCCEQSPIGDFIYKRGFVEGACSDITIKAFDKEYHLHRLILDQSGYFSMLFNGPWNKPNSVHELCFEDDDNITKESFEIAMAMLYGAKNVEIDDNHSKSLIAIGQFLDIQFVVCSATGRVIESLNVSNIASYASFAIYNNYGKASDRILDSIRGLLCSEGWSIGIKHWDGIPCSLIASTVGLDSFYISSEWERASFIIKLIERRQKLKKSMESTMESSYDVSSSPESDIDGIDLIKKTLNEKVYFCHMTDDQLKRLESWKDAYGEPYVDPSVLKDALWLSFSLHRKIATANEDARILGLATSSDTPPDGKNTFFVPQRDRTIYGTPDQINKQILEKEPIVEESPTGKTTENGADYSYRTSKIPPYRFSVGFHTISDVDPDRRVYARTLWYAGSYWNLYIQKIKHKKGYQMGVYVHRATSAAPSKSGLLNYDALSKFPLNSTCESDLNDLTRHIDNLYVRDKSSTLADYGESEVNTPEVSEDDSCNSENGDDVDNGNRSTEHQDAKNSFLSYEDKRLNTSVYCIIYTPSRKIKSAFTCFMSTPELFKKSQSWGWKSNSMCAFNEDGSLTDQNQVLKFMVVLGNV